jgi:hypothetical protein
MERASKNVETKIDWDCAVCVSNRAQVFCSFFKSYLDSAYAVGLAVHSSSASLGLAAHMRHMPVSR